MSGAVIAVSAAAARAAKLREEEERMTKYNMDDLKGWEFKIVRSNTGKFKKYKFIQQLCQEEARAGWEMVEKFDNNRIRFKRPVEKRQGDRHLDIDPYRTTVGMSEGAMVTTILAIVIGMAALIFLLVMVFK